MEWSEPEIFVLVERGLARQICREHRHGLLRLVDVDTWLQTRKGPQVVVAATLALLGAEGDGPPEVDGAPEQWMLELGRHDTDHLDGLSVNLHCVVDQIGIGAEAIPPCTVTQHDHVVGTRLVLFGCEHSADRRSHAQRSEEVSGDQQALESLGGLAVADQHRRRTIEGHHLREDIVPRAEVDEVGWRVRPAVRVDRCAEDLDQPFRLWIGKGTEEVSVQHAEHRRIGADAERQRYDGDGREPWSAAERARREAEILPKIHAASKQGTASWTGQAAQRLVNSTLQS